jgi:hypothetical protein
MTKIQITTITVIAVILAIFGGIALAQQDKYTVRVPGGLAFSEFRGYEGWQVVASTRAASTKRVNGLLLLPACGASTHGCTDST